MLQAVGFADLVQDTKSWLPVYYLRKKLGHVDERRLVRSSAKIIFAPLVMDVIWWLGLNLSERFIALIQREPFDYTKWRQDIDEELSLEEISQKAMALRNKNTEQGLAPDS